MLKPEDSIVILFVALVKHLAYHTKVIEAIQFNDLWWITKAQMFDILLRGGLTIEDCAPIEKQIAEAYYLLNNGVKLANGHDVETEEDYAIHYREMQADLDEDVYLTPPAGMEIRERYCLKLLKSLYGLKQAPRTRTS